MKKDIKKKNTRHLGRTASGSALLTQCFLHFCDKNSREFIKAQLPRPFPKF